MDQNQGCEADVDGVSHVENGHKKSGVYELGHPGYIRKYSHWTEEEYLCRRIDLFPFHGAEESQEKKKQKT